MFLNNYSVRIPEGNEISGGYVEMAHGRKYTLVLSNKDFNLPCNAIVKIDGKNQGTWRIPQNDTIRLERPAHDDGRFTFYKLGTLKAEQAGLDEFSPDLGLIEVQFIPMKTQFNYTITYANSNPIPKKDGGWRLVGESNSTGRLSSDIPERSVTANVAQSYSAGGTGLSGQSSQNFGNAAPMLLDYSRATTINLRLVSKDDDTPRPLTQYSTPVPPRI